MYSPKNSRIDLRKSSFWIEIIIFVSLSLIQGIGERAGISARGTAGGAGAAGGAGGGGEAAAGGGGAAAAVHKSHAHTGKMQNVISLLFHVTWSSFNALTF